MPSLIRRHAVDGLGGCPVQQEDGGGYRLAPEHHWHVPALQQTACHGDDSLVPPLDDAVMLRHVWRRVLPLDAMLGVVLLERNKGELTPICQCAKCADAGLSPPPPSPGIS